METRKLQEVGGGTFTVSIPKEWARDRALEAGKSVALFRRGDGSIVLRHGDDDGVGEVRIDCTERATDAVTRALREAYVAGFDAVVLRAESGFSTTVRRAVRETVRELTGAEITGDDGEELTVRSLVDAPANLEGSVVRLQSTALSIHRRATGALLDGEGCDRDHLRDRHREAVRVVESISRAFNRSLRSFAEADRLDVTRPWLFDRYVTARELEGVARQGLELANLDPIDSPEVAGPLGGPADRARRVVDDATTALVQGSGTDLALASLERHEAVAADLDAVERALLDGATDCHPRTAVTAARTVDSLAETAARGARIAATAVRSTPDDAGR